MAISNSEKAVKVTKIVELYKNGLTEQEICKKMQITRAGFNFLFMEAQKAGFVTLDPNRPEAFAISSRALLESIKNAFGGSQDALVKLERLDNKTVCITLCD